MNILLVYPSYPDTFWSFKTVLKYISKKAAFPPLGLLTVGAMLPRDWNVRLVDANIDPVDESHLRWADMVLISAMVVQKQSALEIISRVKEAGKTVVAGGPLFNTQHERPEFQQIDHFVLDEAEVTLQPFLDDLAAGKPKPVYRSDIRPDISKSPIPAWHLINMKNYATMAVQYSRGCPFNCEFCDIIIMNGRIPRTKPPQRMLAEIDSLYHAGWREGIFIVDDNFIGNTKKVKAMLRELINWQKEHDYPFKFMTEASTNLADDKELMQLMSEANFHKIFLGIETPDVDSLKECGKHQNVSRDLGEAVRTIQRHGMQVMAGFIVGFDNDSESIFNTQIRFIQQVGIVTAMVGLLNAMPQTQLWHRLRAENRLLEDSSGENTDGLINFIPKMGKERLVEGYRHIISKIYTRRNYYKRIHVLLKSYIPTARSRLTMTDLKALFRSMLRIGVFSRAAILYWWLLFKTLITNAKALPVVIELIICGEHFKLMRKRLKAVVKKDDLIDGGCKP